VDGKIDPSWDIIEQEKIELADGKKEATNGWLSSLTPLVPIRPKGSFYLFFTAPGNFIAANFTGK